MPKGLIFSECNTKYLIKNAKQTLEWRRSKVLELASEGRSQAEISLEAEITDPLQGEDSYAANVTIKGR